MNFKKLGLVAAAGLAAAGLCTNAMAFNIDEHVEGFWFEGNSANRGWGFEYLATGPEAGVFFVAGYIYDDEGNPVWVAGQASVVDGQFEVDIPLSSFTGGVPGPGEGAPVGADFGSVNVVFNTCNSADFTFTGGLEYSVEMIRFNVGPVGYDECPWQQEFAGCPAWSQAATFDRTCVISGTYNEDITLTNDTLWVLSGGVFIGDKAEIGDPVPADGPTITIEGGTRIVGSGGADALIISRGSKIIANGMPNAPIVMSGSKTTSEGASSGDWGGLVINGAAPLNTCDAGICEAVGEGDSGAYGGDNPYDDSGSLSYLIVQFAGNKITDTDELNGIAFQGVGDATDVNYVQVHRNADDGIEFFGGTVNAKYLILTDIEDDSLDWTQGYQGNIQFVLVQQIQDDTVDTDRGMELDNLEQNNDATPRSGAVMANFTLLGKPGELGINPRRGTGGNFSNFIVDGFDKCLDVDSAATFAAAGSPGNLTGVLTMENTILNCISDNIVEDDEDTPDPWSVQDFFDGQPGNQEVDPMLDTIYAADGADYLRGYPLDPMVYGEFFDKVDYIGAFKNRSAAAAWHHNWSLHVRE